MKHLEVRQKYSSARHFFNSLFSLLCGDETLRLMPDIQLFLERLSEKICTRQSRKVVWDTINSLFLTL